MFIFEITQIVNIMIKPTKSASILGSQNKDNIEYSTNSTTIVQWYSTIYQNRNLYRKAPSGISNYKQSHPYCLTLHKLSSLSINKKHSSSSLFINISGFLATEQFQILGIPFIYQYEESISRNDNRWQVPLCLYYHSKIDKNHQGVYLFLKVRVLQIKETIVENWTDIGTILVKHPFIQIQRKAFPVFTQFNQADFGFMSQEVKEKILINTSAINAEISIESKFQLKKLNKFVYENSVYTHQSLISGARKGYLQRVDEGLQFKQANTILLKVNFLQIHVSQKYEQDIIAYLKKIWINEKVTDIKSRKIVIAYHNQYLLVNPNHRKLELLSKDIAGQQRILVYQALKQGEVVKLPYYTDDNYSCGMLIVGLIYEINGKEVQLASYYFLPAEKGEQVSEHMMTGLGYGSTYQMIAIPSSQKPTIIIQYECDAKQIQSFQDAGHSRKEMSGRKWQDEQLIKEKQKLKEQIQRQRIEIMKQKQEMQKLKNQHYLNFQAEFEKKFEVEKENLYRKQQLIENQYKQQVERQVRQRFTLEEQIKKMNDKLKNIEESNFKQQFQDKAYGNTLDQAPVSSPRFEGAIQNPTVFPAQRQRIDPGYIIEPQNPVPVKKVREILQKQPKISPQIIKQSQEQFNFASKFTFYFTSMVWAQHVDPPRQIYLIMRFFNLEEFRTDNLTYLQGEDNYYQLVRSSHLLYGNQNQEPSYSFLMDPSDYSEPYSFQKDLIHYLSSNSAIIDIFCGQTHLYVGQLKIKLKELIRGTKTQTLIAKDLALVKLKDKDRIGTIQVMIKNEQVSCRNQISLKYKKKITDVKKKVISNAPIFIKQEHLPLKTEQSLNSKGESIKKKIGNTTRQQLRIQKFKQQKALKSFSQTTNGFNQLDDSEKGVILTKIMTYKEQKMANYIKEVYEGLLNEQINLSAHYGKAVTFPFLFQNTSPFPASFKISFITTDSSNQQLNVVKNSKQWRFLASQHNYGQPKRFDIIGENDTFFLHSGQSIPLVFKFLSFDNTSNSKDKITNVTICKQDNNWIAGGFSLLVQMHQPVVHHSYILYQPGDQMVDLIVPVIYSQTDNTTKPQKLHLTDPSPTSTAHWLNPYQILIRIKTPKIMDKFKFNLLLYNDQYFCELSQNWLIEVYSYEGVSSYFRSDYNTKFKITLPWNSIPAYLGLLSLQRAASTVKLFSSSSALVFKNNQIELDADRRTQGGMQIWCELLGGQNARKNFEITCVGGQQNQLIYGWVVTVFPYMPRT